MRITKITVTGFKSLVDFQMDLSKFTCLIGLNGSGKSTVLQFLDFLSQLARGGMDEWFKERKWSDKEILSGLLSRKQTIDFVLETMLDTGQVIKWEGRYNIRTHTCSQESFVLQELAANGQVYEEPLLTTKSEHFRVDRKRTESRQATASAPEKIIWVYDGSILSKITEETVPHELKEYRTFLRNLYSFDMLAPQSLRRRDRDSNGSIGLSGQRLSAFLYELGWKRRDEMSKKLRSVYPYLESILAKSLKSGWKQLMVMEEYGERRMLTEARHINDGMLRLIAILAELESEHDFLLFDEIENGINPELVAFLIGILTGARQQIMVTTHSPMILNYLDDETAKESVVYLYKTEAGETKAIKFFDIPSIREKLEVMGPGEAFVDTNLVQLADEINTLSPQEAE